MSEEEKVVSLPQRIEKTWYKCDPEKHVQCRKRYCKYNKSNIEEGFPYCDRTSHIEFSIDGIPIIEE